MAAAFVIAGCKSEPEPFGTAKEAEGQYAIDEATREASVRLESGPSVTNMRSGSQIPVDLPGGFSLYPGASIVRSARVDNPDRANWLVTMRSSDAPDVVIAFYRKQAAEGEAGISLNLAAQSAYVLGGEGPDGLSYSVSAISGAGGTRITLHVSADQ